MKKVILHLCAEVWWHKSATPLIPEFTWAADMIDSDMSLRSMCSQGFAEQFYLANKEL